MTRATWGDQATAPAVVVGLDSITGLQTARILAQRGVPVIGVASNLKHFACRTKVVREVIRASTSCTQLIDALEQLATRLPRRAVLYPCKDASVLAIARGRDRLEAGYHVVLPRTATLEMLLDKTQFYYFAKQANLPVPHTVLLHTRADAERAAAEMEYPCVLKPSVRTPEWEDRSRQKAYLIESAQDLLSGYDRWRPWADVLMAQQWIEGADNELFSCNCYFDRNSEPVVAFVARKLRQWPPRIGNSCLGEECRNDEVLELTVNAFRTAGFHGLGYLEVKRDSRTGRQYIIEANVGRPTGRSAIAEAGGVELLYSMYADTVGMPLPGGLRQQYRGVKWIYWRKDLLSAFHYWRRGELTIGQWWRSVRGKKACAVLSWSDPMPFLADLAATARKVWRRRNGQRADSTNDA